MTAVAGSQIEFAGAERSAWLDLISTAKPGIIALELLLTGICFLFAGGKDASTATMIWCLAGGALTAASANCINCIWDRDIDIIMERTRRRPLAAGRLSVEAAWYFAVLSLVGGLALLWLEVNFLSALLAFGAHIFYALIYTVWLKRRYSSNIVIGGVAGAMAPLIGWAGATGTLDATAFCLFLVVFLWTPPHFWALAINRENDYRLAEVPMLPVVKGVRTTGRQMLFYCSLLFPLSIVLFLSSQKFSGWSLSALFFLNSLFMAGILFLLYFARMDNVAGLKKAARVTFFLSILHLGAFFCVLGFCI